MLLLQIFCRSGRNKDKEEIPEPGPPARPPIPQRVIVVPDPAPPRRYETRIVYSPLVHANEYNPKANFSGTKT